MTRSRIAMLFVVAIAAGLALPSTARAQSAFAGVVKDATGAVLPGVTVEASSPALIERVRSVTTDSGGAYKIDNLRPGIYALERRAGDRGARAELRHPGLHAAVDRAGRRVFQLGGIIKF